MRKIIWWILLIVSIAAIIAFVGYPKYKEVTGKALEADMLLPGAELAQESPVQEGWVKQTVFRYVKRSIPELEADFTAAGYPPFLYMADGEGNLDLKGEKSYHEDGMAVYLYMNDAYYMDSAVIEYTVPKNRFTSTRMGNNLPPLISFVEIITGAELDEEGQKQLLRTFTDAFNDKDGKAHTLMLNDLEFTVSLERNLCMIILSC